jgi:DNA-binding beta-propeller fold protein YncE
MTIATADCGPDRYGITLIEPVKNSFSIRHFWARTPQTTIPEAADPDWKGVSLGIAFDFDRTLWISEGDSGKVRRLDVRTGAHDRIVDLNRGDWKNSFTGDLALDPTRHLLYVLDTINRRLAVIDTKKGQMVGSSVPIRHAPASIVLSPDRSRAYITSADSPGAAVIDLRNAAEPVFQKWLGPERVSLAPRKTDSAPGVLTVGDRIYISNPEEDSIGVFSAGDGSPDNLNHSPMEIPLRIPGLETLRGIRPGGMAFDPLTKWLLVTEAGLNAVGVIDTEKNVLAGHIPVGWMPNRVAIAGDRAYVTNSQGRGTGPNLRRPLLEFGEPPFLHRGSVSTFILPAPGDLAKQTRIVYAANGMLPEPRRAQPTLTQPTLPPAAIEHVVLIVKGAASFDEVLGDEREANNPLNRRVQAVPQLARFGMHGLADGRRQLLSVKDVAITPNEHALAHRWAFADNFYAEPEWFPEGSRDGPVWKHLEQHGVAALRFEEDDPGISDQTRADRVIAALAGAGSLPPFLFVRLPGNSAATEGQDPARYPYAVSHVADNDLATGRILQFLSRTPGWRKTVVFVTEATAEGSLDHIDAHRTVLLAAGPWVRHNYVSHTNSDFAGLWKTIFALLHVPPLHLRDAAARELNDFFTAEPDDSPFDAVPADKRVFDPELPHP